MEKASEKAQFLRFATFEVDFQAGELRKGGLKLKLSGQPFQVLAILLERPGKVVTRDELQQRLWPNTFVDVDHNLNTAINKIREVLGDSAENPRFVETLPRRGYRFIAAVEGVANADGVRGESSSVGLALWTQPGKSRLALAFGTGLLLAGAGLFVYKQTQVPAPGVQRTLTRLTFDAGLQLGVTWSPDSRFIAYSSDRGGKCDIWIQQVSGGDPVQVTKGPGQNWQPDWSPDGKYIAYRSEEGDGALFIIPALGGNGLQRRISSFGYFPRWSPDSSQILFQATQNLFTDWFYVVGLDGREPSQVLTRFLTKHEGSTMFAAWHPDGKRISVWLWGDGVAPALWTVPIASGEGIKSEIDSHLLKNFGEGTVDSDDWAPDIKLSWAPSRTAIYFERWFRGTRNLWKMTVDPETLRTLAIERLTTGPGLDTGLALSPDGKKLAFTVESNRVGAWLFPFDAIRNRITGSGRAVTSAGMGAWGHSLSRDGKKLAFNAMRAGKWELWERSLVDGREAPIAADDYLRDAPQWSPDGTRLAYARRRSANPSETEIVVWSAENRIEDPLTSLSTLPKFVGDWSADGKQVLISQQSSLTHRMEVEILPVATAPHAEVAPQKVISDAAYDLWQPHFSPNGRWIVFEALSKTATKVTSALYVVPAVGGSWIAITEGKHWDDKPRWSRDGKTIYFVSGSSGFFNVWGIHFDPGNGKTVGKPFRVTAFDKVGRMIPNLINSVELELNHDQLLLTMEERSGSIWVLDNVDR